MPAKNSFPAIAVVAVIAFSYLIGVILRLFKTRITDRISGIICRILFNIRKKPKKSYFFDQFPFFNYLENLCNIKLPKKAAKFYEKKWKPYFNKNGNREFYNHCKVLLNKDDERNAKDIYSAEALTRYTAAMFYALLFSFIISVVVFILKDFNDSFLIVPFFYFLGILGILVNLRFLRVKEVELVFVTTLKNYNKKGFYS